MANYRKFIVAILGAAVVAIEQGVPLPPAWKPWLTVVTAMLTAAGVYRFPNEPDESTARHQAGE